ncbi:hypothetical protein CR513_17927, partial [Mucuna pruriens]
NKFKFVNVNIQVPNEDHPTYPACERCNNILIHSWIINFNIVYIEYMVNIGKELKEHFSQVDLIRVSELKVEIYKARSSFIICSQILLVKPLHCLNDVFSIVIQYEKKSGLWKHKNLEEGRCKGYGQSVKKETLKCAHLWEIRPCSGNLFKNNSHAANSATIERQNNGDHNSLLNGSKEGSNNVPNIQVLQIMCVHSLISSNLIPKPNLIVFNFQMLVQSLSLPFCLSLMSYMFQILVSTLHKWKN